MGGDQPGAETADPGDPGDAGDADDPAEADSAAAAESDPAAEADSGGDPEAGAGAKQDCRRGKTAAADPPCLQTDPASDYQPRAAAADTAAGEPGAAAAIRAADQSVPPALAQLGVSGTCLIRITVAPDGSVISASIARSSGIPLIDQTALQHAMQAHLSAFNSQMPNTPQEFLIPVEIDATDSGD